VQLSGGCHCGNLRLQVQLTRVPGEYSPRSCDCDFCRKHGAAWLSDPQGSLRISVRDARQLGKYAQGSGTAELLLCRQCGVLVGACLSSAVSVADKVRRWQQLWFSDVSIIAGEAAGSGGVGASRA
jgi:hypothetical protein